MQAKFIEPTEQQAQNNGSTENVSTVTENNSTDLIGNNSTLPENFLEKVITPHIIELMFHLLFDCMGLCVLM